MTAAGLPDSSYGVGGPAPGVVAFHVGGLSIGLAGAIDSAGRLVVVGNTSAIDGSGAHATFHRLMPDGSEDTSFATASSLSATSMTFPRQVLLLDHGDLVVVGTFIAPEAFNSVPGAVVLADSGQESATTGWPHVGNEARIDGLLNVTVYGAVRDGQGRITMLMQTSSAALARLLPPKVIGYVPVDPARLLDTRLDGATVDGVSLRGGLVKAGGTVEFVVAGRGGVAPNAVAASLNITVTETAGPGFVTVYPCGTPQPLASNLNFVAGQTVPNAVITKIGSGGRVCVFSSNTAHVIADVNGYHNEP